MAHHDKLLSIKGQDPLKKLPGSDAKKIGGSTPFDADVFPRLDATAGVTPDKTLLPKAAVKADPLQKIKSDQDKQEKAKAGAKKPKTKGLKEEKEEDEDDEAPLDAETTETAEDDEESFSVDDEDEAADPAPAAEEGDDEDGFSLEDLLAADGEDIVPLDSGDEAEAADVPAADGDDEAEAADEDEPVIEEDDETELFPVIEVALGADEEGAEGDEDDEEPIIEGKLNISFRLDESDLQFGDILTEDNRRTVRNLVESAVLNIAQGTSQTLHEAYERKFRAAVKANEQQIAESVDRYLTFVVNEWVEQNRPAVTNRLRVKLTENLMRGLHQLFEQHYIDVPDSKVDVVETLTANLKSMRAKLRESIETNVKLTENFHKEQKASKATLLKEHKARLIAEQAARIPDAATRSEFKTRAATVRFTESKAFKRDLDVLRESVSGADETKDGLTVPDAVPLMEEKTPSKDKTTKTVDPLVGAALLHLKGNRR